MSSENHVSRRTILLGGAAAGLSLAVATPQVASAAVAPATSTGIVWKSPLAPDDYLGRGTVFTRSVAQMPLAPNSATIAAYMPKQPAIHQGWGVVTSLNTTAFNLPIYRMDSSISGCTKAHFSSSDIRVNNLPLVKANATGPIPFPSHGVPAGGGDMSFTVIDQATGWWREYFYNIKQSNGSWTTSSAGVFKSNRGFTDLATSNYWMQCTQGTSSVVGMMNSLSQIGIEEVRAGTIGHALSFTIANHSNAGYSFPAKGDHQQNKTDANPGAPRLGQWFRLPPTLNLATLGLRPFTLMVATAVQKYGGYAADRNLHNHAFNAEHPVNETAQGKKDPWAAGGDIFDKYASGNPGYKSIDLNDFPWSKTEWAPVNWSGR
ncbi:hypothetical protein [Pseudoclavibacter helvolus]|uniref:hypothetical protein n=1 Tax=Pseudoclavibacter helvolus TaxID=255205 RepID=UPI000B185BF2|nr:hypothetical protein [Pseudoclavibacter helvolus]